MEGALSAESASGDGQARGARTPGRMAWDGSRVTHSWATHHPSHRVRGPSPCPASPRAARTNHSFLECPCPTYDGRQIFRLRLGHEYMRGDQRIFLGNKYGMIALQQQGRLRPKLLMRFGYGFHGTTRERPARTTTRERPGGAEPKRLCTLDRTVGARGTQSTIGSIASRFFSHVCAPVWGAAKSYM